MHRATTTCHLANIAFRVGHPRLLGRRTRALLPRYNAGERRFIQEDAAANAFLVREPRRPWTLAT